MRSSRNRTSIARRNQKEEKTWQDNLWICTQRLTTLGPVRLRSTGTRQRFLTLCGAAGRSGKGSSKCRRRGTLLDSSKKPRSHRRQRHRHLSIHGTLCRRQGRRLV